MKTLVGYYSRTDNTKKMAEAIARGIKEVGLLVDVKDVGSIRHASLLEYQAIIFGSPTYYGAMAAEMKKVLDESIVYHGKLSGKVGGAFTSSGGIGGGGETTILGILAAFLIHGMIVIGESGFYHYGPLSIETPQEGVIDACAKYGQKIATFTKKIFTT